MRRPPLLLLLFLTGVLQAQNGNIRDALQVFRSPEDSTRTKVWWFHDDDMEDGCHKVFWYFFK